MKILYVSTISDTINAFLIPHIERLVKAGHVVDIACNFEKPLDKKLVDIVNNIYKVEFSRKILSNKNISAYNQMKKLIIQNEYNWINTHTPVASAITRIVCKNINHTKLIYTCHGFSFCKGDARKNWAVFYPIEKYLSRYTDVIITINHEDYKIAKNFNGPDAYIIPGIGVDIAEFKNQLGNIDINQKKRELGLKESDIVISSIGELSSRKNHQIVIKAIKKLDNPHIKYLICGEGSKINSLTALAKKLNIEKQVLFLGFRTDIKEILNISDVFVFPSKREGLGLAGIEAMAANVPIVASNRHGIVEYAIDGKTALTCDPNKEEEFAQAITKVIDDDELSKSLVENAYSYIEKFDISNSLKAMDKIFEKIIK